MALWRTVGALAHYDVARGFQDGTYQPTADVLRARTISFITWEMVARGCWTLQPDNPALYPNVPAASGHHRDLATYVHPAGALPDRPVGIAWADWSTPATRGWFALVPWQALESAGR